MSKQGLYRLHEQQISAVLHYILENLGGDLRLNKLAGISNYSPFHFQKIFKQHVGESPKQHITRLRLENAAHYLVIQRDKTVTEIALDSGFASGSTFARAFRQYFGVSAETMRQLSPEQKAALPPTNGRGILPTFHPADNPYAAVHWKDNLQVVVKRSAAIRTIFTRALLSDSVLITDAFKKTFQFAETRDLLSPQTRAIGIINPHQQFYSAALSLNDQAVRIKGASETIIPAGKFATYVITGTPRDTLNSLHAFYELWLPQSGYRIGNSNGYELLLQNPLVVPYETIEREIHIAIEPI